MSWLSRDMGGEMTEYMLCADPGKRHLAWALFAGSELDSCGIIEGAGPAETARSLADLNEIPGTVYRLVVEAQRIYPGRNGKDPNDMLDVARNAGAIEAVIRHERFVHPQPRSWKGTVPKAIFTQRIETAMTPEEHAVLNSVKLTKKFRGDVLDAIGLGLWMQGRIGTRPAAPDQLTRGAMPR